MDAPLLPQLRHDVGNHGVAPCTGKGVHVVRMGFDLRAQSVAQHRAGTQIAGLHNRFADLQAGSGFVHAHFLHCAQDEHAAVDRRQGETFDRHRVSKTHPMKTVSHMARQEVIETTRGRSSGLHLLGQPGDISIGDFDRSFETDFALADCFDWRNISCLQVSTCILKDLFGSSLQAFLETLDAATLGDIVDTARRDTTRERRHRAA